MSRALMPPAKQWHTTCPGCSATLVKQMYTAMSQISCECGTQIQIAMPTEVFDMYYYTHRQKDIRAIRTIGKSDNSDTARA